MHTRLRAIAIFCFLSLVSFRLHGQQLTSVPRLFEQLQSEETTKQAMQEFIKLGPSNPDARKYLAAHLPALISQEPKDHPHVWMNSVRLAGAFRITEAIPALIKQIGLPASESASGTLAEGARLEYHPAGKALSQIGESAIPVLIGVLEKGDPREQWVAYRALFLTGSPRAISALRDHLNHEPDPIFKREIQQALEGK